MNKLKVIKEALESNPEVVIIKVEEPLNTLQIFDFIDSSIVHIIDYKVAPKRGLYTADELQEFMMGLVHGIEPTFINKFVWHSDKLRFGNLSFVETIIEEQKMIKRIFTLKDKDMVLEDFVNGQRIVSWDEKAGEFKRIIYIIPYPNEKIANDILIGKLKPNYEIYFKDMKKYINNLVL